HINEDEFIAEIIDPETLAPAGKGNKGELVLTNLGRVGMPLIRYRTGDLAVISRDPCTCGRRWARLIGGVLGRVDDMITIRGINVERAAHRACAWRTAATVPVFDQSRVGRHVRRPAFQSRRLRARRPGI